MLQVNKTSVMNFENAIRGARNPMNSWGRMDSYYDEDGNFFILRFVDGFLFFNFRFFVLLL